MGKISCCHCAEAAPVSLRGDSISLSLRGAQYPIPLSLRGAKRRGNPFSFLWWVRICNVARGNGLPRQCAHWLAMTGGGKAGALIFTLALWGGRAPVIAGSAVLHSTVIARSEATWQSVLLFVAGAGSLRCKGERIAAPVCALARNDRGGTLPAFSVIAGSAGPHSTVIARKPWGVVTEGSAFGAIRSLLGRCWRLYGIAVLTAAGFGV